MTRSRYSFLYEIALENILFPIGDFMLRTNYISSLKKWRKIQWYSIKELQLLEANELRRLLQDATVNNKYYKSLGIQPQFENPAAWLRRFPILYKKTIKENLDKIVNKPSKLEREVSSGSSGIQGEVFMTKKELSQAQAAQTLFWEWAGFRLGFPILQLGMTLNRSFVKRIKDMLLRTDYQQAFNLSDAVAIEALRRSKNENRVFGGYASGLYSYACIAENNGMKDVKFHSVISWGDKMFQHYRAKIETVFKTKVFDVYGSTEGLAIAGQCEFGNFHVLSPHVYLEFLDADGNEAPEGEPGYIVITRLDAFAMPLIRYYIGDLAIGCRREEKCECGRNFPMIKQIIGRDTDIVRTRSGKYLIVHFFTGIFEHYHQIKQFQIVQKNLDSILVNYIIDENTFDASILEVLRSLIQSKLKEKFEIQFEEVDQILPTASGKPQIIKSYLLNQQLSINDN